MFGELNLTKEMSQNHHVFHETGERYHLQLKMHNDHKPSQSAEHAAKLQMNRFSALFKMALFNFQLSIFDGLTV